MPPSRFSVAYLGKRDGSQIPRALAEAGRLGAFVTGAYPKHPWVARTQPRRIRAALESRRIPGLSANQVESHGLIELIQHLSKYTGDRSHRSWTWANRALSWALRDRVRRSGDDILTYEPYAWEAFTADYDHRPRKMLFHFHLHPAFERALLASDEAAHPPPRGGWQRQDARPEWDDRIVDLWRHADLVLCASSFTKRSLVEQGLSPERAVVIPYGIDLPKIPPEVDPRADRFEVLFVGSAIQRKGLHHLLEAWRSATLPRGSRLTIVSRSIDPALEPLLAAAPESLRVLRGISGGELKGLFRDSTLFVLPSLLEGFGQVYLEALAHGCPVLGTAHSCLPDLGGESDGVFLTPAGDIAALRERLESMADELEHGGRELRIAARALAARFPWERFRRRLVETLDAA